MYPFLSVFFFTKATQTYISHTFFIKWMISWNTASSDSIDLQAGMKRTNTPTCVHGLEPSWISIHPRAFHLWYPNYQHLNSNPRIPWTLCLHWTVVLATYIHREHWISAPVLLWTFRTWLIDFALWWSHLPTQKEMTTKVCIHQISRQSSAPVYSHPHVDPMS